MARCLGPNPPYGCGHHAEHVTAAKKGWITRRAGVEFASKEDHGAVRAIFGKDVTLAHEHPSHAGFTVFKSGYQWYELPTKIFKSYAKHGKLLQAEEAKAAERQRREDERLEQEEKRKIARLEKIKDRERAQREKKALQQRQREERDRLKYERQRERDERRAHLSGAVQYQEVVQLIRASGGIKPYRGGHEREEYRDLPRAVKTLDTRRGGALDDMAATVNEHFPGLKIHNDSDLARYLQEQHRRIKSA